MASLADLNLPNNIVYDERTKRYHDLFQNYRMVGASRVAAMGTPQRADRSDQYITRQEFFGMRDDVYRLIFHVTELTREALQALFEMQRGQSRDTERLAEYERDTREERAERKPSLAGRLASGAMERVGSVVRARPGLSLASILGAALIGFVATPNETVQRFGNAIDELISTISNMTDILRQIAMAAGVLAGIEIARRVARAFNRPSSPRSSGGGAPSRQSTSPRARPPAAPSAPSRSIPTPSAPPTGRPGAPSRIPGLRLPGQLAPLTALPQIAEANRMLSEGSITPEQHRSMVRGAIGGAVGGVLGGMLGGLAGPLGAAAGATAGASAGAAIATAPSLTPEQREQRLRERAANTAPGSPERRNLERTEASNALTNALRNNRISNQEAVAISQEMRPGGIYNNRVNDVTRALREGGRLEISPEVARRVNLPAQMIQTESGMAQVGRPNVTIMPPVAVPAPAQPQQQPTPRQQSQSPVMGLQIRNPEQAMFEALLRQALPS